MPDYLSEYMSENLRWMIAFVYLLCGAMRLARFNCVAAEGSSSSNDFQGFPIPAAAGVIGSITLVLLELDKMEKEPGRWVIALPFLMVLLAFLMFSNWPYPSFKALNWKAKRSPLWFFVAVLILVLTFLNWKFMPAVLFVSYMLYGFVRPWISKRWRREIEEDGESDGDDAEEENVPEDDSESAAGSPATDQA